MIKEDFIESDYDDEGVLDSKKEDEIEESNDNGVGTIKLSKPYEVEGDMISKIDYDFTAVKPIQYINLISRLSKKEAVSVPELDIRVQIGFFSLASGISVGDLKRMPSTQDFSVACSKVRNFLLGASDTENEEE
jgi:hypothetical protein